MECCPVVLAAVKKVPVKCVEIELASCETTDIFFTERDFRANQGKEMTRSVTPLDDGTQSRRQRDHPEGR